MANQQGSGGTYDSQKGFDQGGTMTQDPRWYAEQVRYSIAEKVQRQFSNKNATPSEIVEAIRTVSLDDLVTDLRTRASQGGSGGSGSGGSGSGSNR